MDRENLSVRPAFYIDLSAIKIMQDEALSILPNDNAAVCTSTEVDNKQTGKYRYKAGDVIRFGTYPQTADGTDKTPIEWLMLDVIGDKALVISMYGLDTQPYNTEYKDITW